MEIFHFLPTRQVNSQAYDITANTHGKMAETESLLSTCCSEAGNDEILNIQRESKHGFLFCGNYILKYWKVIKTCYNNGQKEMLCLILINAGVRNCKRAQKISAAAPLRVMASRYNHCE